MNEGITVWTNTPEITDEQREAAAALLGSFGEEVKRPACVTSRAVSMCHQSSGRPRVIAGDLDDQETCDLAGASPAALPSHVLCSGQWPFSIVRAFDRRVIVVRSSCDRRVIVV